MHKAKSKQGYLGFNDSLGMVLTCFAATNQEPVEKKDALG